MSSTRTTPRRRKRGATDEPSSRKGSSTVRSARDPLSDAGNLPSEQTDESFFESVSELGLSQLSSVSGAHRLESSVNTPRRNRNDLTLSAHRRTVQVPNQLNIAQSETSNAEASGPQIVIWGTNVETSKCKRTFLNFLKTFMPVSVSNEDKFDGFDAALPFYINKLKELSILNDEPYLDINCQHLYQFDEQLYQQLLMYPQEIISCFDEVAHELFLKLYPNVVLAHQVECRPCNVDKKRSIRLLSPDDIDQLLTVRGLVIRTSDVIPSMQVAFFECNICGMTTTSPLEKDRIAEPTLCSHCNNKHTFNIIHNRCVFSDKQIVKIQECPEDMPDGQTPYTVLAFAHDNLVDFVKPGDRITVTGVYRAQSLRVRNKMQNIKAVYKTYMDVIHFSRKIMLESGTSDSGDDIQRLHTNDDEGDMILDKLPASRVDQLKELASQPDIYEKLAFGIAPSIFEHEDIRKGLLLQLFGGARKDLTVHGAGCNSRSEMHILLCGDPGTSKSQLLRYIYKLAPRSQYTSGRGSSAVGLTAYITKDPDTRQLILQTGALVLADNGICCIDEFDKASESARAILHECMEQGTMSIAKAGIICQLNARTSILAAANPVESRWNANKTIVENIQLPHTLLSRFDLIFLMLDPQDETFDRRLAKHLITLYNETPSSNLDKEMKDETSVDMIAPDLLKDYIGYARRTFRQPKLSATAQQHIIQAYVDMRRLSGLGGSKSGCITAYPRQIESLIRLAEAHAKVHFRDVVTVADVEEAKRLHAEALKQTAVDPTTGKIDLSILTTGISGAGRKKRQEMKEALGRLVEEKRKSRGQGQLHYQPLLEEFRQGSDVMITRDAFDCALRDLQEDGVLVHAHKVIHLLG